MEGFETANERGENSLYILSFNACVRYDGTKCLKKKNLFHCFRSLGKMSAHVDIFQNMQYKMN